MMLSLIVSDAAHGVNIAQRYPEFFQRMMEDWDLYQQFLDSLDLLLRSQLQVLEPLPMAPSRDLSFLRQRPQHKLTYTTTESGQWGVTIQQTEMQLKNMFFPPRSAAATRFTFPIVLDEDQWFTFFRQKIEQQENSWTLWLEGTPATDAPGTLQLALMLVPADDQMDSWPRLAATLTWGHYQEKTIIERPGRINFSPVPLHQLIDIEGQQVTASLNLTLTHLD